MSDPDEYSVVDFSSPFRTSLRLFPFALSPRTLGSSVRTLPCLLFCRELARFPVCFRHAFATHILTQASTDSGQALIYAMLREVFAVESATIPFLDSSLLRRIPGFLLYLSFMQTRPRLRSFVYLPPRLSPSKLLVENPAKSSAGLPLSSLPSPFHFEWFFRP